MNFIVFMLMAVIDNFEMIQERFPGADDVIDTHFDEQVIVFLN